MEKNMGIMSIMGIMYKHEGLFEVTYLAIFYLGNMFFCKNFNLFKWSSLKSSIIMRHLIWLCWWQITIVCMTLMPPLNQFSICVENTGDECKYVSLCQWQWWWLILMQQYCHRPPCHSSWVTSPLSGLICLAITQRIKREHRERLAELGSVHTVTLLTRG